MSAGSKTLQNHLNGSARDLTAVGVLSTKKGGKANKARVVRWTDQVSLAPKEHIDTLLELWRETSARKSRRQAYEWKVNFGIWVAQLAVIGILLANEKTLWSWFSVAYIVAGVVLALLHFFYLGWFVRTHTHSDTQTAKDYENHIRHLIALDQLPGAPEKAPWTLSVPFQAGVTLFLAVMGPIAIHLW